MRWLERNNVSMVKNLKVSWVSVFLLGGIIISPALLANNAPFVALSQDLQCRTSLEQLQAHLAKRKTRVDQVYYKSLYLQIQDFLKTYQNFPANASQLGKCKSFLRAGRDIIGNHSADLGAMPSFKNASTGKLTPSTLVTVRSMRPLRPTVRYVNMQDRASKQTSAKQVDEETTEEDKFLSSRSLLSSSKVKSPLAEKAKEFAKY